MVIIKEKNFTPILVYNAPVDEKTKKVREKFDVDEETGYPRHYNWRALSRLGPDYKPEKPLQVFNSWDPVRGYSTKITLVGALASSLLTCHYYFAKQYARPLYAKLPRTFATIAAGSAALLWIHEETIKRQGYLNGIYVDYMQKHPERFETVHRPKMREVLFLYQPIR